MTDHTMKKTVGICETQPLTAEGVKAVVNSSAELEFLCAEYSLLAGMEAARRQKPAVLIVDKAFGINAILEWVAALRVAAWPTSAVVWGVSMTEAEALRLVQVGAKGIIRKTAEPSVLLACLRTVAEGSTWMEDCLFRESPKNGGRTRMELTPREKQVMELVQQGLKNSEIAKELGIRPGTVKIHLKHIFEKTGAKDRYGLALSHLRDQGLLSMTHA